MVRDVLLQQFARAPRPGEVKTRMQPQLSVLESCELHKELVLWTTEQLTSSNLGEVELCVSDDIDDQLFRQCQSMGVSRVIEQSGDNLGERMHHALARGLRRHTKVLLVGSDCPELDTAYLARAIDALDHAPLVIGPAQDGGYVLIGATQIQASLFHNIDWGSDQVLQQTLDRCNSSAYDYALLSTLSDIDRPEDLSIWTALRSNTNLVAHN